MRYSCAVCIERQPREKPPQLPPPLLLQDPEKARKQTEERVALLLAEAEEFPGTPPLPASELLEAEKSRQTRLLLPAGQHCSLWEFSSLTGPCAAPGSFSATGFALPVPVSTDQVCTWGGGHVLMPAMLCSTP